MPASGWVSGTTTQDLSLFSIDPHMHFLGRKIVVFALTAAGDTIPLNKIDNWQYSWQSYYFFKNLIKIPAGSRIFANAYFDNTVLNPYNPYSPPQLCYPGENTTNEMLLVACQYTTYQPGDENFDLESMINAAIAEANPTGIPEVNAGVAFGVYPNPSNGKFVLSPENTNGGRADILVTDVLGHAVLRETVSNLLEPVDLNLGPVADGPYFVQLKTGGNSSVRKIFVKAK